MLNISMHYRGINWTNDEVFDDKEKNLLTNQIISIFLMKIQWIIYIFEFPPFHISADYPLLFYVYIFKKRIQSDFIVQKHKESRLFFLFIESKHMLF